MIQRYEIISDVVGGGVEPYKNGRFVKYDDHQREIGLLQGFINGLLTEPAWIDKPDETGLWWNEFNTVPLLEKIENNAVFVHYLLAWIEASAFRGRWTRCIKQTLPKEE